MRCDRVQVAIKDVAGEASTPAAVERRSVAVVASWQAGPWPSAEMCRTQAVEAVAPKRNSDLAGSKAETRMLHAAGADRGTHP